MARYDGYTRQRQGRDFPFFNRTAGIDTETSGGAKTPPQDFDAENRDFINKIERFRAETERNATPIDGHEPKPERGI